MIVALPAELASAKDRAPTLVMAAGAVVVFKKVAKKLLASTVIPLVFALTNCRMLLLMTVPRIAAV